MNGNLDAVWKMLGTLNIILSETEMLKRGKNLYQCVFKKWINGADALVDMIIIKLPSPKIA